MCGEEIAAAAKKCKHCKEYLEPVPSAIPPSPAVANPQPPVENTGGAGMIFCRGCGKKVLESVAMCPHCGAPQQNAVAGTSSKSEDDGPLWVPISSMVMGILSFLISLNVSGNDEDAILGGVSFAISSLVLGTISLCKQKTGKGMAIAGIVLAAIALLVFIGTVCG